jgi:hypothetical protein
MTVYPVTETPGADYAIEDRNGNLITDNHLTWDDACAAVHHTNKVVLCCSPPIPPRVSPVAAARIEDARNARDTWEHAAAQAENAVEAWKLAKDMLAEAADTYAQAAERWQDTQAALAATPMWESLTCGCRRGTGLAWCYVCDLPTREGIEEEL